MAPASRATVAERDLYPSLPSKDFRITRLMRLAVFALVVAALLVSLGLVVFQFIWNEFFVGNFGFATQPYEARIELVLPAILLVGFVIGQALWTPAKRR